MNKDWASQVLPLIADDLERFYGKFLPGANLEPVGMNLRIQPCPKCGHHDCCTITPGYIGVNCFHPHCFSGTHIGLLLDVSNIPEEELLTGIGEHFNLPYPGEEVSPDSRMYEIREVATKFYHKQLFENPDALSYQLQERRHRVEVLRTFSIGFSNNYPDLHAGLLSLGYTADEVKAAKVWMPEGVFVYPYIDPFTKRTLRFNTKNPFGAKFDNGEEIVGYSVGNKCMMTTPRLNFDRVILVEGENDLMSIFANGGDSTMAVGGKLGKDQLESLKYVLPKFQAVYCMFDNDDAGKEYEDLINENFPHLNVYHVDYGTELKDPDDYYRRSRDPVPVNVLLDNAVLLESTGFTTYHRGSLWTAQSRNQKLEFEIMDKSKTGALVGNIKYYEGNQLKDMVYDITLAKCKFKPMSFYLIAAMDSYFNEDLDKKTLEDLVSAYFYTKWKPEVVRLIATIINNATEEDREKIMIFVRTRLGDEVTDIVLKEFNELQNENKPVDINSIPKMKIGQFFSVRNNEAFMYFTYVKKDGDTMRKLPYLVANDRQLIRLDLYKKKDEQCMILIRGKYELQVEVPRAIMELQGTSLSQEHVEPYIQGKLEATDLQPKLLIRRIEHFLRRFYYSDVDNLFKVLALWIYGTYCYELFGQYPYLFLNGPKGSGKTIIDTCIDLLAFNPKMTVSISDAALYRTISYEGGTLILDEMENLDNRKKAAESDMAAVLKGGYMRSGSALRCDKEQGFAPVRFEVFGPKVISNINGLEDIIGDRCIQINTSYVPNYSKISKLEDPKQIYIDGLAQVKELTSKCALSVLEHFMTIWEHYRTKTFNAGNARLSQILRPIQTLAYLAGPDYEKAFIDFYTTNVKVVKEDTEYETPEGALKHILTEICREVIGKKEPDFIAANVHKYKNPMRIDEAEGWFEIDQVHIKTFMEEVIGTQVDGKMINTWVRRVGPEDIYNRRRRTTVSIDDEALVREYNGNTRLKVNVYRLYVADFIQEDEIAAAALEVHEDDPIDFEDIP